MSSDAGMLVVLAGPSGAGKTTLARRLVEEVPGFEFSVSTTTRPPRGEERDGTDYFFVSDDRFDELVRLGYFLEWAGVHGRRYGTSRDWVCERLAAGRSVVLDIDVVGARNVRRAIPGAVLVFVAPPSLEVLEGRLRGRGTESGDLLEGRIDAAASEMRWAGAFDYLIVNSDLGAAAARLSAIVDAESARISACGYPRPAGFSPLIRGSHREEWRGRRVLIATGPTREYIDEVRFISNRSSGVMGCELASAFRAAGAAVTLLLGPCRAVPPRAVALERFTDSRDLAGLLGRLARSHDILAMPAAVADFRPSRRVPGKMPRGGGFQLQLEEVEDVSASVSGLCPLLSFSLEFGDRVQAISRARRKMEAKGAFASFVNAGGIEGSGMDSDANSGVLLLNGGGAVEIPQGSKRFVAEAIVSSLPVPGGPGD